MPAAVMQAPQSRTTSLSSSTTVGPRSISLGCRSNTLLQPTQAGPGLRIFLTLPWRPASTSWFRKRPARVVQWILTQTRSAPFRWEPRRVRWPWSMARLCFRLDVLLDLPSLISLVTEQRQTASKELDQPLRPPTLPLQSEKLTGVPTQTTTPAILLLVPLLRGTRTRQQTAAPFSQALAQQTR